MPVLALHCFRSWGASHRIARNFITEISDFCTNGSTEDDNEQAPVTNVPAEPDPCMQQIAETENQMLVRALSLLFLESLVEQVAQDQSGGGEAQQLCDELLWALMQRAAKLNYSGQAKARLGSPRHKRTVAVWQSLCILVAAVQPESALATRLQ